MEIKNGGYTTKVAKIPTEYPRGPPTTKGSELVLFLRVSSFSWNTPYKPCGYVKK